MKSTGLTKINAELDVLDANPIGGISYTGEDYNYVFSIVGPKKCAFENYVLDLSVKFPTDYPNSKPDVKFVTKVVHPNVNPSSGSVCIQTLSDWSSKKSTISQLLLDVLSFLRQPNFDLAWSSYWTTYGLDAESTNKYQDMVGKIKSTMGSCKYAILK
jgi:ubiquitin-protein ligase